MKFRFREGKNQMKKGDKVMIYQDPIKQTIKEGEATLIKCLSRVNSWGCEYWIVKFLYDNMSMVTGRYIRCMGKT